MLRILEDETGVKHRPNQALNFDFTSYFTFCGTAKDDASKDEWVRVSTKSLARGARNQSAPWKAEEEEKCNDLMVKWCDGCAASGHVRPFDDVTAAWRVPNKGTAATVNDGCKRTDGDLLIKLAFDLIANFEA
jgi:hypothetical protein